MQCSVLSLGNWQPLVHFLGNRSLHDTKRLTKLVCYDELVRLAQTNVDEINPIVFECMASAVSQTTKRQTQTISISKFVFFFSNGKYFAQ